MILFDLEKAIQCNVNYGPIFGEGDILIVDRCDIGDNSGANFPKSYRSISLKENNQKSWSAFCGAITGNRFRV